MEDVGLGARVVRISF